MRYLRLIASLTLVLALSACGNYGLPFTSKEPDVPKNILTNLPGENGRLIAVKFDDTRYSHPQEGLEAADLIYVTQVEGGLTRLMAIYTSTYPEIVGPVRSARISDIDILAQHGRVGFIYSGAQSKLRPVLAAANLTNLSAERNPPTIFFNAPDRNAPYAMMARLPLLLEKANDVDIVNSIGWEHGDLSEGASQILSAKIKWPNANYEAIWNQATSRFDLNFDGQPNVSVTGNRLGSTMMVIQKIEITPSEYGDRYGGITPKSNVIGSGIGWLLRDGTMRKVNWSRESATSPTSWSLEDGTPAYFASGQIWIFLTDEDPDFTLPAMESPSDKGKV